MNDQAWIINTLGDSCSLSVKMRPSARRKVKGLTTLKFKNFQTDWNSNREERGGGWQQKENQNQVGDWKNMALQKGNQVGKMSHWNMASMSSDFTIMGKKNWCTQMWNTGRHETVAFQGLQSEQENFKSCNGNS